MRISDWSSDVCSSDLDEGYRLHVEDLDLCRRAREAGAAVAVANDVRVVHVRGVSSRSRPGFFEWHKHRGMWRYFRKFEAPRRNIVVRAAEWLALWSSEERRVGNECVSTCRSMWSAVPYRQNESNTHSTMH